MDVEDMDVKDMDVEDVGDMHVKKRSTQYSSTSCAASSKVPCRSWTLWENFFSRNSFLLLSLLQLLSC